MLLNAIGIQSNNQVKLVTVARNRLRTDSDSQEGVTATDEGLIGGVSKNVQPISGTNLADAFAGSFDTLPGCPSYGDCKIVLCHLGSLLIIFCIPF
jgi:hypothetical protein